MKLKKMFFELLISPLTISDNYFVNSIIVSVLGFIAFKVAFKIVGDIGARGEVGSLLHWSIRLMVFFVLWFSCCVAVIIIRFVVNHIILLSCLVVGLLFIIFVGKSIYKRVFSS